MPKTFLVTWHMDGVFEMQAENEEAVHEVMKTLNKQELVFKSQDFEYDIEPIDRSAIEPDR